MAGASYNLIVTPEAFSLTDCGTHFSRSDLVPMRKCPALSAREGRSFWFSYWKNSPLSASRLDWRQTVVRPMLYSVSVVHNLVPISLVPFERSKVCYDEWCPCTVHPPWSAAYECTSPPHQS